MPVFEVEYYETLISLHLLNVASINAFRALPSFELNYVKCTYADTTMVFLLYIHGQLRCGNPGGGGTRHEYTSLSTSMERYPYKKF
jgi:hypothetical protein